MNFSNLFGKKPNLPEPEYFLAVEIHESLIKTALWEVHDGQSNVLNIGTYELWADEDSLINGVDSSLEQAVKVINSKPNRVIFGLPDSWMEEDKIHPTKIKLVTKICKELGLEPIGAVTINRALAHFLKKRDGVPPTAILLEVYTTKIALSYIYLGEVKDTEEVAKSGDIGSDIEEGLTRMELSNYPARFILTNGSDLTDESQQVTAHPWQDRLPFKHLPKVESLPVDFSIRAIALVGGTEAVKFMGITIKEETEEVIAEAKPQSDTNLDSSTESEIVNVKIPDEQKLDIEEHGFFYEEISPPEEITKKETSETPKEDFVEELVDNPENQIVDQIEIIPPSNVSLNKRKTFKIPKIKLKIPHFKFTSIILLPILILAAISSYFIFGKAEVTLIFSPQNYQDNLTLNISQNPSQDTPTLIASMQKVSGSTSETIATTGTATVGERATGTVTIANKTVAPLVLKKGTILTTDNGKYSFSLDEEVTIASASSGLLDVISGKATEVKVTATRIGPEYNLSQDNALTVDNYSKSISLAITEKEFTGGTSRTVNAVSKDDQEKLIAQATEKIKQIIDSQVQSNSPGKKTIPLSEMEFTKKTFDKNIGDESTTLSLDLEGTLDTFVYDEQDLFDLVQKELSTKIPTGNSIKSTGTNITVASLQKKDDQYQVNLNISATLYPQIDNEKLASFIKGKPATSVRHFFEPIKGFSSAEIKITPPVPFLSQYIPLKNISFQLVAN